MWRVPCPRMGGRGGGRPHPRLASPNTCLTIAHGKLANPLLDSNVIQPLHHFKGGGNTLAEEWLKLLALKMHGFFTLWFGSFVKKSGFVKFLHLQYMNPLLKTPLVHMPVALLFVTEILPHDKLMRINNEIVFEIALRKPLAVPKED